MVCVSYDYFLLFLVLYPFLITQRALRETSYNGRTSVGMQGEFYFTNVFVKPLTRMDRGSQIRIDEIRTEGKKKRNLAGGKRH